MAVEKFFSSLDPKADGKIVQLNLLRVAVVFLFFYLSLWSVSTYYFHRPQGHHTYHRLLKPDLSILFESGPIRVQVCLNTVQACKQTNIKFIWMMYHILYNYEIPFCGVQLETPTHSALYLVVCTLKHKTPVRPSSCLAKNPVHGGTIAIYLPSNQIEHHQTCQQWWISMHTLYSPDIHYVPLMTTMEF